MSNTQRLKLSAEENNKKPIELSEYKSLTNVPFSQWEIENLISSLNNLKSDSCDELEYDKWSEFIESRAHLSHKNWSETEKSASLLKDLLKSEVEDELFQSIFKRVLEGGNWHGALKHAESSFSSDTNSVGGTSKNDAEKPWVVLVTGLNGIRKSTSIYQDWFEVALRQALIAPPSSSLGKDRLVLPVGSNSFFRQLDFMIATLANEDFVRLYHLNDLKQYSELKDAIFVRYRKLAEALGVLLVKEAKARCMNVMLETSGKDIAMFEYVDHFFDDKEYNKLVLHFKINDICHAERSVDIRMEDEISRGRVAVMDDKKDGDRDAAHKIVAVNAGGPYGSEVLKGVQFDSSKVWEQIQSGSVDAGKSWYKASFYITGHDTENWKLNPIVFGSSSSKQEGGEEELLGDAFEFIRK